MLFRSSKLRPQAGKLGRKPQLAGVQLRRPKGGRVTGTAADGGSRLLRLVACCLR